MPLLLITAAIDVENKNVPFTNIVNREQRLMQYIYSINYAIENYNVIDKIVFVDNTNFHFDYSELEHKAKEHNKQIEFLFFKGNYGAISNKGKGYGEMEDIEYAISRSKLLAEEVYFYKLTGRVVIENFDKIVASKTVNNAFLYFSKSVFGGRDHISTVFYSINKSLYSAELSVLKNDVSDKDGIYIEDLFFRKLLKVIDLYAIGTFKIYPFISGLSGSSGLKYDLKGYKRCIYQLYAKMEIFNINKKEYPWVLTLIEKLKNHGKS